MQAPSGVLGTTTSSRRFKRDIHSIGAVSEWALMALRPVTFHYKPQYIRGQPDLLEYGLIAEDVAKVYPDLRRARLGERPVGQRRARAGFSASPYGTGSAPKAAQTPTLSSHKPGESAGHQWGFLLALDTRV
jgi:hypothetical protein